MGTRRKALRRPAGAPLIVGRRCHDALDWRAVSSRLSQRHPLDSASAAMSLCIVAQRGTPMDSCSGRSAGDGDRLHVATPRSSLGARPMPARRIKPPKPTKPTKDPAQDGPSPAQRIMAVRCLGPHATAEVRLWPPASISTSHQSRPLNPSAGATAAGARILPKVPWPSSIAYGAPATCAAPSKHSCRPFQPS